MSEQQTKTPPHNEHNMKNQPDLTIVLPIYNEAQSLRRFLPQLLDMCIDRSWRVIIVNDGSKDQSSHILKEIVNSDFALVLHHKVNRGYGGALKTGLANTNTPFVLTMDGDGQHPLEYVSQIYEFAREKDADMVVGSRAESEYTSLYRKVGKFLIRTFTRILVPLPIKDLNSGFKIYRTEIVQKYLALCPDSMAFSDVITLLFIDRRHLVLEYPITVNPRMSGTSTINTKTAFETIVEILNIVMLLNPLRIFLPLSVLFVAIGLLWGLPIILVGRGVSVGAMLAILLGTLFFFLGLIASQLSAIRIHQISDKSS
jgi:glycosyltransferase involved in cell wall biosynthesis